MSAFTAFENDVHGALEVTVLEPGRRSWATRRLDGTSQRGYGEPVSIATTQQFRRLATRLAAEGGIAGASGHGGTTGAEREAAFARFLRPLLPGGLRLSAGVIEDSTGQRSRQQDCVLVDPTLPGLDLGSGSNAVLLAESVLATIEVKSYLDSAGLRDSLDSLAQTRRLVRTGEHLYSKAGVQAVSAVQPILGYIFAYEGMSLDGIGQVIEEFARGQNDGGLTPEAVCVLDRGVVTRSPLTVVVRRGAGREYVATLPDLATTKLTIRPLKKDALLAFFERLREGVFPLRIQHADTDAYFSAADAE